jgi:hypothetical protein
MELGSEKTPDEYVANMVRVFQLVRDVLAPHGVVWCNVGDSYNGYYAGQYATSLSAKNQHARQVPDDGYGARAKQLAPGNLCLIPQRLAIALQEDGWIVRSVVVWHKPAPMPCSVRGWAWERCRAKCQAANVPRRDGHHSEGYDVFRGAPVTQHPKTQWSDCPGCPKCKDTDGYVLRKGSWRPTSSWEPILMLAKSKSYFCDGEAVKQTCKENWSVGGPGTGIEETWHYAEHNGGNSGLSALAARYKNGEGSGKANLRDVWTIAAEPLSEKHYASFPTELVHRCLASSTSARGYCVECGIPWVRVVANIASTDGRLGSTYDGAKESVNPNSRTGGFYDQESRTLGWRPSCKHQAATRPARVLDPFCGSGRTGVEAVRMGLDFVGVELNPAYVEMATRLIKEEFPLFGAVCSE